VTTYGRCERSSWRTTVKKRKIPKLTAEDRARFDERTRRFQRRMAERERIDAQLEAAAKRTHDAGRSS
jgi:hypothetical protein